MKQVFLIVYLILSSLAVINAQESSRKHLVDGGMMLHTGYLSGNIESLNYQASGMPD